MMTIDDIMIASYEIRLERLRNYLSPYFTYMEIRKQSGETFLEYHRNEAIQKMELNRDKILGILEYNPMLFICEKCGCIENTRFGHRKYMAGHNLYDEPENSMDLCSECTPRYYKDRTPSEGGRWHGKFEKRMVTRLDLETRSSEIRNPEVGWKFVHATEQK